MARYELTLPKMGESVAEATIISWAKEIGESIEIDDIIVEVATDKVDSEIPSEVEGKLIEILHDKDAVVAVGDVIAIIEIEGEGETTVKTEVKEVVKELETQINEASITTKIVSEGGRFYSPLVKNMATKEGIGQKELDSIDSTGAAGRLTKEDMLLYLKTRDNVSVKPVKVVKAVTPTKIANPVKTSANLMSSGEDTITQMCRMGKLVAKHMINSLQTSPHVQSFIEVDVTNIVTWRNRVKNDFLKREGEKLTFTPIFMQAVAHAIKVHPLINVSLDGDNIIQKKNVNLGMAAALPDGNLIVPVIKNADQLSLVGMAKQVNGLANKSRANKLSPDDIQGGTYTVTNIGSFGSVIGTPIINQPQVAILAIGAIRKTPSVIETPDGDFIGIRHKMFLSHSYDHRVVNGALGGMFIKTIKDYLEAWSLDTIY